MEVALSAQNLIHFANISNYTVRIVNNHNAYDYLSHSAINSIKQIHQKSKIDLPVYELLRLALLYEHGGVAVRLPNLLFMQGLDWVQTLMDSHKTEGSVLRNTSIGHVVIHH